MKKKEEEKEEKEEKEEEEEEEEEEEDSLPSAARSRGRSCTSPAFGGPGEW